MAFERFEDILAWQKARSLARSVYRVTRDERCVRDYRFCSQLQSAAVSIMSSIAEGFERRTPKQFAQYLVFAKASCAEARSLLYVGIDVGYFDDSTFNELMENAHEVARLVSGLRKSLRAQPPELSTRRSAPRNSELGTRNLTRG